MDDKNFLLIDGILIPDMESEALKIYENDLDVYIRMISGRLVCEESGKIWVIDADFEDIDTTLLSRLDGALRSRKNHIITFLPSNGSTESVTSEFYMTARPQPALKSWMEELPEWSGLSYTFEEVNPHD